MSIQVSVILPTRDRPALLERAVKSVLSQEDIRLELVVVDNNLGCPPVSACGAEWLRDPRVVVIHCPGATSAAAARNAGLAACTGDFITYLDDDDAYRPGKIRRQYDLCLGENASLVLCGATFRLRGRKRVVQVSRARYSGDELLLEARWNTPLIMHRRIPGLRFDESLRAGEDAELAHRILALAGDDHVPCVPCSLVDIYPQDGPRVNTAFPPMRKAARRILVGRRGFFSGKARHLYVLRLLVAREKLRGNAGGCLRVGCRLLLQSRGRDWRLVLNALLVASRISPGSWVT
jgi:glycosyltransferase involved in cell wall biosynthesis